ncbi:MAG: GNAT family N-acetyltransferase [Sphaerobacteraceae bacterium]|nr:MAG: GNAT family N-acetyltransferase [Sphaerobacteraceae bacterium]
MYVSVIANCDRTDRDREQLQRLTEAVYPADGSTAGAGGALSWSNTELSVVVREVADGEIAAHVGVLVRDCLHNGHPVRIGGIGGVKTDPDLRTRGLGRLAMTRGVEVLRDDLTAEFGLLVCPESASGFYDRLGWQDFRGELWVDQPNGRTRFTMNQVKVLSLRREVPVTGIIDLLGFPW